MPGYLRVSGEAKCGVESGSATDIGEKQVELFNICEPQFAQLQNGDSEGGRLNGAVAAEPQALMLVTPSEFSKSFFLVCLFFFSNEGLMVFMILMGRKEEVSAL